MYQGFEGNSGALYIVVFLYGILYIMGFYYMIGIVIDDIPIESISVINQL